MSHLSDASKHTCSPVLVCVFQGVIGDLKVVGDPRAAERHCEEEEDDSDAVSQKAPLT